MSDECRFADGYCTMPTHATSGIAGPGLCRYAAAALRAKVERAEKEAAGQEAQSHLWAEKALVAEARVRQLEGQLEVQRDWYTKCNEARLRAEARVDSLVRLQ